MNMRQSAPPLAGKTGGSETLDSTRLLIDTQAVCATLSLSPRTVWSLTNRGALPSRRVGRSVRYCPAELRAWVEAGCPTEPGAAERVRAAMRKGAR
jgi:predicted DNA-binding transcriptional regulator AlpA